MVEFGDGHKNTTTGISPGENVSPLSRLYVRMYPLAASLSLNQSANMTIWPHFKSLDPLVSKCLLACGRERISYI